MQQEQLFQQVWWCCRRLSLLYSLKVTAYSGDRFLLFAFALGHDDLLQARAELELERQRSHVDEEEVADTVMTAVRPLLLISVHAAAES